MNAPMTTLPAELLPYSPEAEQSVLGALMLDPSAFGRVQSLDARHFFDRRNALVWTACAALASRHKPIDVIAVFEELKAQRADEEAGGLLYINDLAQCVPSARNIARHAEIVREKAAHRALLRAADEALALASEPGTVADKLDKIGALFAGLQRQQVRKMPRRIADIAIERTAYYDAVQAGTVTPGWPTHIPSLDRLLNGGLRSGSLNILAARPSVGKSSLSQYLATGFARDGLPTLFLSQEMPDVELADRAVSATGRIDYSALLTGKMSGDDWGRASEALEALQHVPLYVDDQAGLTLADVRTKARSIDGLKVLVLDYLQLCDLPGKDNRNNEVGEVSKGLKSLAKDLGIAIIALSQLNRAVEQRAGKRPTLSDLRDSGAIEQDADVVMFLWRPDDDRRDLIGLGIDKNRQGQCGQVALHFEGAMQRWGESTESLDAVKPAARRMGGFE